MIQIDDRYLKDETTRNNSIVRYEVLAGIFINEYINNEVVLYVGTDPQKLLPDIHNKDNTIGFEVVRCEAKVDFVHDDVKKELVKIDYDYKKYLKIKNKNLDHVFNKVELELAVEKGRIRTTHVKDGAHDFDWIVDDYRETINKKLKKLNNGNYKNCSNISLII